MEKANLILMLILMFCGCLFLIITLIFSRRKEKACDLVSGFSFFTEAQKARYDRAAMARDYKKLFALWTAVFFICAVLCIWLGWWAFGAAMALLLISCGRRFHADPEKAFARYKL